MWLDGSREGKTSLHLVVNGAVFYCREGDRRQLREMYDLFEHEALHCGLFGSFPVSRLFDCALESNVQLRMLGATKRRDALAVPLRLLHPDRGHELHQTLLCHWRREDKAEFFRHLRLNERGKSLLCPPPRAVVAQLGRHLLCHLPSHGLRVTGLKAPTAAGAAERLATLFPSNRVPSVKERVEIVIRYYHNDPEAGLNVKSVKTWYLPNNPLTILSVVRPFGVYCWLSLLKSLRQQQYQSKHGLKKAKADASEAWSRFKSGCPIPNGDAEEQALWTAVLAPSAHWDPSAISDMGTFLPASLPAC